MKPSDLDTPAARIQRAMKDLFRVWDEASEEWDDSVAAAFRERRVEPVAPVVKDALDAIQRMRALLHDAQRELQD